MLIKRKYKLKQLISDGLLYHTYLAEDQTKNSQVMVLKLKKEYLPQHLVKNILKEAHRLHDLKHPHILTLTDHHFDGKNLFLIYHFDHTLLSLESYVSNKESLENVDIITITTQLMNVLQLLESSNIVSGAINLTQIFLTREKHVKLVGIHIPLMVLTENITAFDAIEGCIFYSPEFLQHHQCTHLDQYSLGVLMYFLHTLSWPYPYTSYINQQKKYLLKDPCLPRKYDSNMSQRLEKVIFRAMAKDPHKRFSSILELHQQYVGQTDIDDDLVGIIQSDHVSKSLKKDLRKQKFHGILSGIKVGTAIIFMGIILSATYHFYMSYITEIPLKQVPNILGISVEEAKNELDKMGLKSIVAGTRPTPYMPEGYIMEVKPPPGREVKQNRVIRLFVSKGSAETLIPNLLGRNLSQSQIILDQKELKLEIESAIYSHKYQRGQVVLQHPTPNGKIEIGETIYLIVSKGF
ncbi:MAG: PASTA domain-containing protein, partial [Candidatus Margulisbacteria bacterium]|nr:PASTA domain-containing protein [Candidatus Margulisiibacteriota bacterium]